MTTNKPKLIPRFPMMNAWGCMFGLVMLVLGLSSGALVMIYALPMLWNYDAELTEAWSDIHQMGTAQSAFSRVLDATLQAQSANGTQMALAFESTYAALNNASISTQMALNNNQALLNQTATQSARFILATLTAQAVRSEQERTRVALDYAATQVALQQNATQVQLDFARTQAALGENSSSQSLPDATRVDSVAVEIVTSSAFAAQSAAIATASPTRPAATATAAPVQPAATNTAAPVMTATSLTPVLLPPTNTPTSTPMLPVASATSQAIDDTFKNGIDAARWSVSGSGDWQSSATGIKALRSGAWLMSNSRFSGDYHVIISFIPALVDKADYVILFNVDNETALELRLYSQALNVRQVTLGQRNVVTLGTQVNVPLTGTSRLSITFNNGEVTAVLNNQEILTFAPQTVAETGTVGVQFPKDAVLTHIEVIPS